MIILLKIKKHFKAFVFNMLVLKNDKIYLVEITRLSNYLVDLNYE